MKNKTPSSSSSELRTSLLALRSDSAFERTDWGVVQTASRRETPHWMNALDSLCRTYWSPLYGYLRHRGYGRDEAKDLTQGFFVMLLEKNFIETATPEKGRFRSFLLSALKKFVSNQHQRERALKRGREFQFVSLSADREERFLPEDHPDPSTPETIFERRWALTVLDQATQRLKGDYDQAGKGDEYDVLAACLDRKNLPEGYNKLAARLQMKEGAVRVAVHRLKIRYALMVRTVIAETVAGPDQVEDELKQLQRALAV